MGRLLLLLGVEGHGAGVLAFVEHLLISVQHVNKHLGVLVACRRHLLLL